MIALIRFRIRLTDITFPHLLRLLYTLNVNGRTDSNWSLFYYVQQSNDTVPSTM